MPSADFCDMVEMNRFTPSHDFVTCRRSPEVSSTAFNAQPPDLPPVSLMDMGFAIMCPLARHRRPHIRFLFIGSRLCSTLLSGPASRRVFTLALCYDFTSIWLSKGLSPSSCRTCSAHTREGTAPSRAYTSPQFNGGFSRAGGRRQAQRAPDRPGSHRGRARPSSLNRTSKNPTVAAPGS